MGIVDYVAPIIFVAAINGYIWHPSWIVMFLLKNNKLFVTNSSTIFILGILIYHIQLYERKPIGFGKVKALLKYTSWFGVENHFWANIGSHLGFWALRWSRNNFSPIILYFPPSKHMLRYEVCGSVIIRSWVMEYPIFSFSYFSRGSHFENAPGEGAHRKLFLLTLQILIL